MKFPSHWKSAACETLILENIRPRRAVSRITRADIWRAVAYVHSLSLAEANDGNDASAQTLAGRVFFRPARSRRVRSGLPPADAAAAAAVVNPHGSAIQHKRAGAPAKGGFVGLRSLRAGREGWP